MYRTIKTLKISAMGACNVVANVPYLKLERNRANVFFLPVSHHHHHHHHLIGLTVNKVINTQ